jgi:hypothetical protein
MSIRQEDRLQTIEELSYVPQSISKACTVGVIIDATNAYFDESKTKYVKKIKLVDDTYNTGRFNPHNKYSYLTVFFYSPKIEDLPNPRHIGDLLYLRRYLPPHSGSPSASTTSPSRDTTWRLSTARGRCWTASRAT